MLVDNTAKDPLADVEYYLNAYQALGQRCAVVVGVTRRDLQGGPAMATYNAKLAQMGHLLPVFAVDARSSAQVMTMLGTLVAMVEARTASEISVVGSVA